MKRLNAQQATAKAVAEGGKDYIHIMTENVTSLEGGDDTASRLQSVLEDAEEKGVHVICLQETRHTLMTIETITQQASVAGWRTYFGQPDYDVNGVPRGGVIILTNWPSEQVELEHDVERRALAIKLYRHETRPLTLINVYLDSSDARQAIRMGEHLLRWCSEQGGDTMIIGDWNRTPSQTPASTAVACGAFFLADEIDGSEEQPTRTLKGKKGRHIDYAIHTANVPVIARRQWPSSVKSDHDCVSYKIKVAPMPPRFGFGPTRALRTERDVTQEMWENAWKDFEPRFWAAIARKDSDEAWSFLSRVAEQLLLDDENGSGGRPRHVPPRPRDTTATQRKKGKDIQGILTRRLLRLRRRVVEYQRVIAQGKTNLGLLRNINKRAESLCGKFDELLPRNWCAAGTVDYLDGLITDTRAVTANIRIKRWETRLSEDEKAMARWVQQQPPNLGDAGRLRPAQVIVEETALSWSALWNPQRVPDCAALDGLLGWTSEHRVEVKLPTLTGKELRRITRANKKRAAGTDNWAPGHWALLPMGFFDCLAALWNGILHDDIRLPDAWLDVRVVLIPKEDTDEMRPLSVCVQAWRAGMTAIMRQLYGWITSWMPTEVVGGIPGRDLAELHEDLHAALFSSQEDGEEFAGCKVDLRKAFDRANGPQSIRILCELGLPPRIGQVIQHLIANQRKWFEWNGAVAKEAVKVTNSLLQGCPTSMLLMAAQAALWVYHVKRVTPNVKIGICVDDRALRARGPTCVQQLVDATAAGEIVDKALGAQRHPDKLASFGRGRGTHRRLVSQRHKLGKVSPNFLLLGIRYSVQKRKVCQAEPRARRNIPRRLRRIRMATTNFWMRKRLLNKLVAPAIAYPGAWTTPTQKQMQAWTTAIENMLLPRQMIGRSPYLLWKILGPEFHPEFMLNRQALRHEMWRYRRIWCGKATWDEFRSSGRWPEICKQWGWRRVGKSEYVTPQGVLDFGSDGLPAIWNAAKSSWLAHRWKLDKRTHDPSVSPDRLATSRPVTEVHERWGNDALSNGGGEGGRLQAALGCGFDAKVANKFAKAKKLSGFTSLCACGEPHPDREHWMWKCTHLNEHTANPPHLAMRKLGIPRVHRRRRAVKRVIPGEQVGHVAAWLAEEASRTNAPVLVATDGGAIGSTADTRCAAWGVAVARRCRDASASGEVTGLDQTAFAAELFAAQVAISAAIMARIEINLVIDNQAVQKGISAAISEPEHRKVPRHHTQVWCDLYALLDEGYVLSCEWVPSHGKKKDWTAPSGSLHETRTWRRLNNSADKAANTAAQQHYAVYETERVHQKVVEQMADEALERMRKGSYALLEHVKQCLGYEIDQSITPSPASA